MADIAFIILEVYWEILFSVIAKINNGS